MIDSVDAILDRRLHRLGRRPAVSALAAAVLAHLGILAAGWGLQHLPSRPAPRPRILAVKVIPAQRLGSPTAPRERPAPQRPPAPKPRTEPPKTEPPQTPPPKPAMPPPEPSRREPAKPETPAASAAETAADTTAEPPPQGRRGSPQGDPLGTTAFGARIAGLDNPAFTYDYYLDRMLAMIEAQWVRPPTEGPVETTLFFRIARDGSVSELRVAEPSGFRAFDLAAVRAVQNAAPLPPLPRSYRQDSLGVNLIVR
jgi:TonB family protein